MGLGKTTAGCEVLETLWFSQTHKDRVTGIVLVQCEHYKVAYVGSGNSYRSGPSEEEDAIHIAETGAKLPEEIARAAFNNHDLSDYKPG